MANPRASCRRLLASIVVPWLTLVAAAQFAQDLGWPNYGNDVGGTRYSSAQQIDHTNVTHLRLAWTYRTGAMQQKTELKRKAAFEATPVLVDNKLFLSTPYMTTSLLSIRILVPSFGSMTPR
jgi:glucose dehydrogenase